jgi:purine-binding chemotaxis protein CheW
MISTMGAGGEPGEGSARPGGGAPDTWLFCLRILGGRYAFEASLVTEVVRLGPLTRLPAAPAFLPGVFTHRGEVLAVLDPNQLLGRAPVPVGASTRAAIVHCGPWKLAVLAEAVEGITAVPRDRVEPPPPGAGPVSEFLSGVARDDDGTVAVLDLARMVDAARARSVPA